MYGYVTIRLHNEYHYYAPRKLARVGPRLLPSTINGTVAEKEDRYRRTGACSPPSCLLESSLKHSCFAYVHNSMYILNVTSRNMGML